MTPCLERQFQPGLLAVLVERTLGAAHADEESALALEVILVARRAFHGRLERAAGLGVIRGTAAGVESALGILPFLALPGWSFHGFLTRARKVPEPRSSVPPVSF